MGKRRRSASGKAFLVTGIVTAAALVAMIGVYQNIDKGDGNGTRFAQEEMERELALGDMDGSDGGGTGNSNGVGTENSSDLANNRGVEYEGYENLTEQAMAERNALYRDGVAVGDGTLSANDAGNADSDVITGSISENTDGSNDSQEVFSEKEQGNPLTFSADTGIAWPLQGNVLMNYSMDKTIYFATLDQYKYNPAIIIEAKVNDKVVAGAKCKIVNIETNENTGLTVTADLGSGYQAVYGQLKEVKKTVGDTLEADDVVGYIAEPTKYYSVEGSNLYFAMTKDGKPVNPMEYLK